MSFSFGRTTTTSYNGSAAADVKYAGRFYLASAGDLYSLVAYLSTDVGGAAPVRFALYSDGPGALLAQTEAATIPAGTAAHWRELAFASPPSLSAAYYYIAVHTSASTLNIYRDDTGGLSDSSPDAYSDGFENPYGGSTPGTKYYCFHGWLTEPNQAPYAPTGLSPSGGTTINPLVNQTISWIFGDPDSGDTQAAYNHRYRIVGAGSWTETGWTTSPYGQHVYAGSTFVAGEDYEHQVQTKDNHGLAGPWTSSALFSVAEPPDAPTITDPANEATITTATYDMDWSIADQDAYQARRLADLAGEPDPTTIYEDTGTVEEADTRTKTWTLVVNSRTEHWQVRVRHDSIWGAYASVEVDVAFTAPMTPTLVVAVEATSGRIKLTPTQPTPTGDPLPPTVVSMQVFRTETDSKDDAVRIATDLDPEDDWYDYQALGSNNNEGVPAYKYFIRAVGSTGATADSDLEG